MIIQQICRVILWGARVLHIDGLIPDKWYLQMLYRRVFNKKLNLRNPQSFNEKLQWMKLYDRRPEYTTMVDKYAVKKYVADVLGDKYIIPTLGVWDKPEDIDWDNLPDQFVLKCTHDSGGLVICREKSRIDKSAVIKKLRKSLNQNYYIEGREWPYKGVPRRIIAEKYIEDSSAGELLDYKFFCFDGKVKFFKVDFDRFTDHKANYYDKQLNPMPFREAILKNDYKRDGLLPDNIKEMMTVSELLSKGLPFCRIDLYNIGGKVMFGEYTFYPAAGFGVWSPDNYDVIIGNLLKINTNE